jgi:pyruvate formate lyase activating enzyme
MLDTASEIKTIGLKNVVVSNGFINPGPLEKLLPYIDAFNIDLKSFSDGFYRKMTGGSLDPVLETLKTVVMAGKHLEITLLIIPTLNDSPDEFSRMTDWILNLDQASLFIFHAISLLIS